MENKDVLALVEQKANEWLAGNYDEPTKAEVRRMLEAEDKTELIDSFYKDLEFGTGGLRGIMGAGTNRMNIYTVGAATQGLSNYLKKVFSDLPVIKVAIGYDSRNNSRLYSETSANIFSANGFEVYLFEDLRPTPELSFAIRELGCQSGIILTASHNPKEYNGYKAYWNDGSQVVAPHDVNIIEEVGKVTVNDIKFEGVKENITIMGADMDEKYLKMVDTVSLFPEVIERQKDLKIVFTPIHGSGVKLVPMALKRMGFTNVINIPEQDVVSGDFPTVASPNPEEPAAMGMALKKAKEVDADIVMATDPDADRLGIAIKNDKGEFVLVNGNQTALLLLYYIITKRKELGMTGKEYIVKTIVTSELISEIAKQNNVELYDCYTGFKYIADVIRDNEGVKEYIGGGEESFGFLPADFVRDKDAVSSCALMAEIAAWAKDSGKSLYELLQDIYLQYGFSKEKMVYVVRKGKSGADEIKQMMVNFRANPPKEFAGSKLSIVKDYASLVEKNILTGEEKAIEDKKETANVLQFFTEDGTKISVRPSGTEPKIKFYVEVQDQLKAREEYDAVDARSNDKVSIVAKELGL